MGPTGSSALVAGISAYSLQQSLLANDVANANTPGFQPSTMTFQKTLAGQLEPVVVTDPGLMTANGNGVDMEAALVQLESGATRLEGLDSLFQGQVTMMGSVINNLEGA